jgi:hypothetical protein
MNCQKLLDARQRGAPQVRCANPEWKDGLCKLHHPECIAERKAKQQRRDDDHRLFMAEKVREQAYANELRDRLAIVAFSTFIANPPAWLPLSRDPGMYGKISTRDCRGVAQAAYDLADAMIKARNT